MSMNERNASATTRPESPAPVSMQVEVDDRVIEMETIQEPWLVVGISGYRQ